MKKISQEFQLDQMKNLEKGSVTNTVTFENDGIPQENLIGSDGRGFGI